MRNVSDSKEIQMIVKSKKNFSVNLSIECSINWRVKLASKKLHCANFVPNLPIIASVMQNNGDGQKSEHMPKIMVLRVIVTT